MSEEAKALKCTGVGYYYHMRLWQQIPCPECGFELNAGSITEHRCRMHGTESIIDWNQMPVSQTEHQPQVYDMSFPRTTNRCPRPLPSCPGSSSTLNGLRSHFIRHHWGDRIRIPE